MARESLEDKFVSLWKQLGRDPDKLVLDDKTDEELEDGIEKLNAIRISFSMLFDPKGNHDFAVALLKGVFYKEEDEKHEQKGDS